MPKTKKKDSKKLRGVWTGNGKFLPFPLPIYGGPTASNDVGEPAIKEVLLHYGDPNEWHSAPPLMVEVRAEFVLAKAFEKLLIERAEQLHVDVEALPELATLEQTKEEEKDAYKSCGFAAGMVILGIFRWLGWREDKAPNGLRVPTRVPVASPKPRRGEVVDSDGRTSLEYAILDMREEALRYLPEGSTDRAQFVAYCEYWDRQHGKSNALTGSAAESES